MKLSVIVPTFNEAQNVPILVQNLTRVLKDIDWEVIFVDDDSPDGTAGSVRTLGRQDPRVRCLQRIGRRGLSTAVIEGMLSSNSTYIAVIDGDLQHDETLLPKMLDRLEANGLDIVIGSRYVAGGSIGTWDTRRAKISKIATELSRLVVRAQLSDPMSGFFMLRQEAFFRTVRQLSGQGYKILLDLFASSPVPLRYEELPYTFRPRGHGQSKLDSLAVLEYLMLLVDKVIGHIVPARFIFFAAIGFLGVFIHLTVLGLMLRIPQISFIAAQTSATLVAMTFNFYLNNVLTYRDQRLRGVNLLWGLLSFYGVCSVGVLGNVGIANYLHKMDQVWWLAGIAGALVGSVWNYVVSSVFTWGRKAKKNPPDLTLWGTLKSLFPWRSRRMVRP